MNINLAKRQSSDKERIFYLLEWGRNAGQRVATGIYTYVKPQNQQQKSHNKEAMIILEMKRSQMVLDQQSIGSGYIPQHKMKNNFLDYYQEFVKLNSRKGNRHLSQSLNSFKKFIGKRHISAIEINETLCQRFRKYLLDNFNGETPANYFSRFKQVLEGARKDGYFKVSPAMGLASKTKSNFKIKDILEADEYKKLMNTPLLAQAFYRSEVCVGARV
jgi:hypothetical protein